MSLLVLFNQAKSVIESDLGSGADVAPSIMAEVENADIGIGADAVLVSLSSRLETETGIGVDALVNIINVKFSSDTGEGQDDWAAILAAIKDSDTGKGVESSIMVVWVYLLLKLLQENSLNMDLSQKLKTMDLKLSQEGGSN